MTRASAAQTKLVRRPVRAPCAPIHAASVPTSPASSAGVRSPSIRRRFAAVAASSACCASASARRAASGASSGSHVSTFASAKRAAVRSAPRPS
ncbi:hypothetical protein NW94_04250 [Burkholderia mallei]|nr:hypothetical protein BHL98_10860 [Burkholderia mallei]ATD88214.1 hypothetical protein NM78_03935 [Burkholderia mallei]ATD92974.1 hypothetical protein NW91_03935 [Burkholderia mallei]ATD97780.1 hypothetical protein NW92_04265 [Burkholderia mallei]ATE02690.1 hypothetical protein NW93_04550 [Burkholderia mallei]